MNRRGFIGSVLALAAAPWGRSIAVPLSAGSLLSIDDMLRSMFSEEIPVVDEPEPLLFSLLPKSTSFWQEVAG